MEGAKYSKEAPFTDPVVRCSSCGVLLLHDTIQKYGCCKKCGNRRVTNVRIMTDKEMQSLKAKGGMEDFIAIFEGVDDDGEDL
jgi:DNA-directed RNA polymerase subunit RPC12/RpoP